MIVSVDQPFTQIRKSGAESSGFITQPWFRYLTDIAANNYVSVRDYGAIGNGIVDDGPAINGALSNTPSGSIIVLPPGTYRTTQTIFVPPSRALMGLSYGLNALGTAGAVILPDLAVTPGVLCGSPSGGTATALINIVVSREAGVIPVGTEGVKFTDTDSAILENVHVYRQDIGFHIAGHVDLKMNGCGSTIITGSHIWLDGAFQVRTNQFVAGKNGGVDVSCNQYIRISGAGDTYIFENSQFNLSAGNCNQGIVFDNYTGVNGEIGFTDCHFERLTNLVAQTGTAGVNRFWMDTCSFNNTGQTFNVPAAFFNQSRFINSPFVLGPTTFNGWTSMVVSGNTFLDNVVVDACDGVYAGNTHDANLTKQGTTPGLAVIGNKGAAASVFTRAGAGIVTWVGNTINDATKERQQIDNVGGYFAPGQCTFAQVGAPVDGVSIFVTDGLSLSAPLAGGGTGCLAVRQNGGWVAAS